MAAKVLVVDDDEIVGNLTLDLLLGAGLDAELINDSAKAMAAVRLKKPDLVVLDILMPGIDGLTICHSIKSDPLTERTKVVMVSGKAFAEEQEHAMRCGADLVIKKPYDVASFAKKIQALLGTDGAAPAAESAAPPARDFSAAADPKIEVGVWGCRSLSPHTTRMRSRYGYQTACVSMRVAGHFLIFDAGSGIIDLSQELRQAGELPEEVWLFLTHFHQDHVQGLGFLPCARQPATKLNICGANDPDRKFEDLVREAFERFPTMEREPIAAEIQLYELQEECYEMLPEVKLTAFYANHPSTTLGFMLETQGHKVAYCPDSEIYGEAATALQDYDQKLAGMVAGADLLIHNGRFTDSDYMMRRNNGHSSFASAVDLAARANVKKLLIFHHDDQYGDEALDMIGDQAAERVRKGGYSLECVLARAGMKFSV